MGKARSKDDDSVAGTLGTSLRFTNYYYFIAGWHCFECPFPPVESEILLCLRSLFIAAAVCYLFMECNDTISTVIINLSLIRETDKRATGRRAPLVLQRRLVPVEDGLITRKIQSSRVSSRFSYPPLPREHL